MIAWSTAENTPRPMLVKTDPGDEDRSVRAAEGHDHRADP